MCQTVRRFVIGIAALVLVAIGLKANAGQVSCVAVMRKVNSQVSRERGRSADLSVIAKALSTSVPWVERCMRVYGRHPRRPGLESSEGREAMIEDYEENEPEESAREDVQEEGARDRPEHPEHSRYTQFKFTPTPELGYREQLEGFE